MQPSTYRQRGPLQHKQGHFKEKLLSKTLYDMSKRPKPDPELVL
jgi:hypothetical protein